MDGISNWIEMWIEMDCGLDFGLWSLNCGLDCVLHWMEQDFRIVYFLLDCGLN